MKFPPPYTWFTNPPYEKPDRENVFVIWLVYAAIAAYGASLGLPVLAVIFWAIGETVEHFTP